MQRATKTDYQDEIVEWLRDPSRASFLSNSEGFRAISAPNGFWLLQKFEGQTENGRKLRGSNRAGQRKGRNKPNTFQTHPWATISGLLSKPAAAAKLNHL